MGISANDLCQHVIRPTLDYLSCHSPAAEALLLGAAACQSALGSALDDRRGHGLYRIASERHQQLWDQYLALDPERASRVRGLASQHAFLAAPHLELTVNLRYSTAIAWSLVEAARLPLPDQHDHLAQARVWRQVFQPHGRLHEFIDAWQRCIGSSARSPDGEWKIPRPKQTNRSENFYIQTRTVALPSLHWHRSQPLCSAPCGTSEHWRRSGNLGSLRAVIHRSCSNNENNMV